ncbi:hypothetical protein BGZ76_006451, partial [Entomortierella beljakovae]
ARKDTSNLVKLNLRNLPVTISKHQLTKDLIETFSTYGEITVLGIYYHHETNIFEGEGMMIIDTEHFGTPLQRMVEIPQWGRQLVNVHWRGAPTHCFKCRAEGHIARNCTMIQNIVCDWCKGQGHSANTCPSMNKLWDEETADQSSINNNNNNNKSNKSNSNNNTTNGNTDVTTEAYSDLTNGQIGDKNKSNTSEEPNPDHQATNENSAQDNVNITEEEIEEAFPGIRDMDLSQEDTSMSTSSEDEQDIENMEIENTKTNKKTTSKSSTGSGQKSAGDNTPNPR